MYNGARSSVFYGMQWNEKCIEAKCSRYAPALLVFHFASLRWTIWNTTGTDRILKFYPLEMNFV